MLEARNLEKILFFVEVSGLDSTFFKSFMKVYLNNLIDSSIYDTALNAAFSLCQSKAFSSRNYQTLNFILNDIKFKFNKEDSNPSKNISDDTQESRNFNGYNTESVLNKLNSMEKKLDELQTNNSSKVTYINSIPEEVVSIQLNSVVLPIENLNVAENITIDEKKSGNASNALSKLKKFNK